MRDHGHVFSLDQMAGVLGVSRRGYYNFIHSPISSRMLENEMLLQTIQAIFKESGGTYGSPRVHAELRDKGFKGSRQRIARLMKRYGLQAKMYKKFKKTTPPSQRHFLQVQDLVKQNWSVTHPNKVWVADITFIKVHKKWCYLAVVLDVFSRKIVGMALKDHMKAELVLQAIAQALNRRKPGTGLIHHSDKGGQYICHDLERLAKKQGIHLSYGKSVYDNSVMESFFHTLKTEWVYFKSYQTLEEARLDIFQYIFAFYNTKRRHSTLNYQSPQQRENQFYSQKNIYV